MYANQSVVLASRYCERHQSKKEIPNVVCLNFRCFEVGLLCRLCCSQQHKDHDTVSLDALVDLCSTSSYNREAAVVFEDSLKKLEVLKKTHMAETSRLLSQAIDQLLSMETWIQDKFQRAQALIVDSFQEITTQRIDIAGIEETDSTEQINQKVRSLLSLLALNRKKKQAAQQLIGASLDSITAGANEVTSALNKVLSDSTLRVKQVRKLWKSEPIAIVEKFFSEKSSQDIHVSRSTAERIVNRTVMFSTLYCACVLGRTPIYMTSKRYSCRIRVDSMEDFISVGLVETETMERGSYHQFYLKEYRIPYLLISSQGTCKSSSLNLLPDSFAFQQGDEINLELDTHKQTMTCRKIGGRSVTLSTSYLPDNLYSWAVFLHRSGDAVTLIDTSSES